MTQPPLIVDGHEDLALNILCAGRDYRRSVRETRAREADSPSHRQHAGLATLGLPEWIAGRVAVIFATIFTEPARSKFSNGFCDVYETAEQAYQIARRQLEVYRGLTEPGQPFRLVRTAADLDAVLATWDGEQSRQVGLVLLIAAIGQRRRPQDEAVDLQKHEK